MITSLFTSFYFGIDSPGGRPKLVSFQRFYYDVAGMEHIEWPEFLAVFAIASLIPTIVVQAVVLRRGRRPRVRTDDRTRPATNPSPTGLSAPSQNEPERAREKR